MLQCALTPHCGDRLLLRCRSHLSQLPLVSGLADITVTPHGALSPLPVHSPQFLLPCFYCEPSNFITR